MRTDNTLSILYDNLPKCIQEAHQKHSSLNTIKICTRIYVVLSIKHGYCTARHMPLAHEYKLGWCFSC
ncbi:hypothetical protein WN48_09889 [Eufriesea mexicana]|uniref:Uncharacterized protein n=1 Tax=Eufriesea mexicana TaxID=516756 RepID=A0A310SE45_9HYME|nr:hypothetical protein WN48_09889 [Eufriesea mexicana]